MSSKREHSISTKVDEVELNLINVDFSPSKYPFKSDYYRERLLRYSILEKEKSQLEGYIMTLKDENKQLSKKPTLLQSCVIGGIFGFLGGVLVGLVILWLTS